MKIRFKGSKASELERMCGRPLDIEGVKRLGCDWVKEFPEDGRAVIYQRSHWEEVAVWKDVTAQCEFVEANGLPTSRKLFHGTHAQEFIGDVNKGYRLRKVTVIDETGMSRWAFIVEKSE